MALETSMKSSFTLHQKSAAGNTQRGMTLVEVMIVVVIVGVLSTLAIYGVSRYIRASQSSEANAIIVAIKGAQEVYRQDTMKYLPISLDFSESYPAATPPPGGKIAWTVDSPLGDKFKELGVQVDTATHFVFSCVVANAGAELPEPPTTKKDFGVNEDAVSVEQRFMVVGEADLDGDPDEFSYALSHNLTNEIYTENTGK